MALCIIRSRISRSVNLSNILRKRCGVSITTCSNWYERKQWLVFAAVAILVCFPSLHFSITSSTLLAPMLGSVTDHCICMSACLPCCIYTTHMHAEHWHSQCHRIMLRTSSYYLSKIAFCIPDLQ